MKGQLDGLVVLDLSRVLAGPMAGQMLADLGAQVIKVEQPGAGDDSRHYGPPFLEQEGERWSSFHLAANRGKQSVTIDFSKPAGRDLVRSLALKADVLIENYRVGTLARYGLSYADLQPHNPGLIYCSISGFGQEGPYKGKPGYDAIFQAMGGLMSSIGHPDNEPGGGPMRTGLSITDVLTSLYSDIAILGALYARDARGGTGEYIDMALLDCTIATMSHYALHYLISGQQPPRRGNGGNGGVPSQVFQCKEGAVILTVGNDAQFARFAPALGHPEWLDDPRFAKVTDRIRNREIIVPLVKEVFLEKTAAEWLAILDVAEIPAGPIYEFADVFADPQVQERGIRQEAVPPGATLPVPLLANPIRFRERPIPPGVAPPRLGEHTEAVLTRELGLDAAALAGLRASGVI